MKAAGILFYSPDTRSVFLVRRSQKVTNPGVWTTPGGHIEKTDRNDWGAAVRECLEELNYFPFDFGPAVHRSFCDDYTTFTIGIPRSEIEHFRERVKLNWENDAARWFEVETLWSTPEKIHPCLEEPCKLLLQAQDLKFTTKIDQPFG